MAARVASWSNNRVTVKPYRCSRSAATASASWRAVASGAHPSGGAQVYRLMRMTLALQLGQVGLDEEAAGHLREIIRRSPRIPEAHNNLAVLLARRGETLEAESLFRQALEIDPAYRDARANLEALTGRPPPAGGEPDPAVRGLGVPTTHGGLFGAPAGP